MLIQDEMLEVRQNVQDIFRSWKDCGAIAISFTKGNHQLKVPLKNYPLRFRLVNLISERSSGSSGCNQTAGRNSEL